jgi:hypothetical protein
MTVVLPLSPTTFSSAPVSPSALVALSIPRSLTRPPTRSVLALPSRVKFPTRGKNVGRAVLEDSILPVADGQILHPTLYRSPHLTSRATYAELSIFQRPLLNVHVE